MDLNQLTADELDAISSYNEMEVETFYGLNDDDQLTCLSKYLFFQFSRNPMQVRALVERFGGWAATAANPIHTLSYQVFCVVFKFYDNALDDFYTNAVSLKNVLIEKKHFEGLSLVFLALNTYYSFGGLYHLSLQESIAFENVTKQHSDLLLRHKSNVSMMSSYSGLKNYSEAIAYAEKSIAIFAELQRVVLPLFLQNYSQIYLNWFNDTEDYSLLEKAITICEKGVENLSDPRFISSMKGTDTKPYRMKVHSMLLLYYSLTKHAESISNTLNEFMVLSQEKNEENEFYSFFTNIGRGAQMECAEQYEDAIGEYVLAKEKIVQSVPSMLPPIRVLLIRTYKKLNDYKSVATVLEEKILFEEKRTVEKEKNQISLLRTIHKVDNIEHEKKILEEKNLIIEMERKKSDDLLLNILPFEIAAELKETNKVTAKLYTDVSVFFCDITGFTQTSALLSPAELIQELDEVFIAFDAIIGKYNIEKIKTIGDSYMCAAGLPDANPNHAKEMTLAALEMLDYMCKRQQNTSNAPNSKWAIRAGIHSGEVIAGVVGKTKFAFDIWGDTVNIASRMESHGASGKLNISEATFNLIKHEFVCEARGKLSVKGKGELEMYFVNAPMQ